MMNGNIFNIKTSYQGILLGLTFFFLGNSIASLDSDLIKGVLCTIGLLIIIYNFFRVKYYKLPFRGNTRMFFNLYIILVVIMIIRGYTIDYRFLWQNNFGAINYHFFSQSYLLPYFLPFVFAIGIRQIEFKTLTTLSYYFNVIFIILFIVNIYDIYHSGLLAINDFDSDDYNESLASKIVVFFTSTTSFFVLCGKFIPKKLWYLNVFCLLLAILTLIIGARRGGALILIILACFTAILHFQSLSGPKKYISFFISISIFLFAAYLFYSSGKNLFRFIMERGLEDTRSAVDEAMISQMDTIELWLGKGLNGRYYMPLLGNDYLNGWRYSTETGFYNLVLKGGYLLAITYILLLIIPAFNGIFKSNNNLTKALGIYILISLIELYPFGWLMFNLKFFVIWIGIILCSNKNIRMLNDSQIKSLYFSY